MGLAPWRGAGTSPPSNASLGRGGSRLSSPTPKPLPLLQVAEGCKMAVEHLLAMFVYTYESALYRHVQDALQATGVDHPVAPFIPFLNGALAVMDKYDGPCYIVAPTPIFDPDEYVPKVSSKSLNGALMTRSWSFSASSLLFLFFALRSALGQRLTQR